MALVDPEKTDVIFDWFLTAGCVTAGIMDPEQQRTRGAMTTP
jgi:hypothetical protein